MKLLPRFLGSLAAALILTPIMAAAQSTLPVADAAAFIGTWTLTLESPQGPFEQTLAIKDVGGKVSAVATSAMAPAPTDITDITKAGNNLVLKFTADLQGNTLPVKVTLTPQGDKTHAAFDIMDGAFVMEGPAVKK